MATLTQLPMQEPTIQIEDGFVENADALYTHLVATVAWDERMQARKTASVGRAYNYSGMTYPDTPMPEALSPIVARLTERLGFAPNNCLMNYYESGDATMGFHSDSTEELAPGTGVAIVSLGAERSITFRNKEDRSVWYHYPLRSGSLLYMSDAVQAEWQHAIRKQAETGGRISLTFRRLA